MSSHVAPCSIGGYTEEASTWSLGTCMGSCMMDQHIFHGEEGSWKSTTIIIGIRQIHYMQEK